jgi:LuxR family transcriptional regulator, maltose regulon positive regulatory protein
VTCCWPSWNAWSSARPRCCGAAWCLSNGLAEEALEYSIAAEDIDTAARLVGQLCIPTYYQGRSNTPQRRLRWLEEHDGITGHPIVAVRAAFISTLLGRPVEALRWARVVDRWQDGDTARPTDSAAEAWAALLGAILCRDGVRQMCADADEAVERFAAEGILQPGPQVCHGLARVVSGDRDSADESFADAVSVGEQAGTHEAVTIALCERSLLAMARNQWDRAEILADQVRAVVRRSGIEQPTACTVLARVARHRETSQRFADTSSLLSGRPELTYAFPVLAVQVQIELARVHLALADLAGTKTLMREIDAVLRRRPDLGTLVGEAQELRDRLAKKHGSGAPGASALTAAELRLMPLLSTHMSVPEIAAELFVSRGTVKSQVLSIYRKLDASSRTMAVGQARELGLLEGRGVFQVFGVKKSDRPRGGMVSDAGRRRMSQMARFRETLRRLAVFHESFVADEVGLRLELAETSALDPERGNAALL